MATAGVRAAVSHLPLVRVKTQYVIPAAELLKPLPDSEGMRADIFISEHPDYEDGVIISVKALFSGGTATQKLAYLLKYEAPASPYPIILLLLGNWDDKWIKEVMIARNGGLLVEVFTNLIDFAIWLWESYIQNKQIEHESQKRLPGFWS